MPRLAFTLALALAGAAAAAGQSRHEFAREYAFPEQGATTGPTRLVVRPAAPTAEEDRGEHALVVELTAGSRTLVGRARADGDDRTVVGPLRATAPGAVGGLADRVGADGAEAAPAGEEAARGVLEEDGRSARLILRDGDQRRALDGRRTNVLPIDGADYVALDAGEKRTVLWDMITTHPYPADGYPALGSQEALNAFDFRGALRVFGNVNHIVETFRSRADVLGPRWKLRHPFGAIAQVELVPLPGHPYGGVLAAVDGAAPAVGLARLTVNVDADDEYNPGVGLKLLVSEGRSLNLVASTVFDPADVDGALFSRVLDTQNTKGRLRLDHLAAVGPAGPAPDLLRFVPTDALSARLDGADFRDFLAGLPAGTELFELRDADDRPVARLRTESAFVASDGGDRLFHTPHHGWPKKDDAWTDRD